MNKVFKRRNALVVEDHPAQRFVLVQMLEHLGFNNIYEASNAAEALDILINSELEYFDFIFTDLEMPGGDGIEFIREIKNYADRISGLVLISSHKTQIIDAAVDLARSYGISVFGGLAKPVSLNNLEKMLERTIVKSTKQDVLPEFSLEALEVALRNGQFLPFYQPKLDLLTQKITGVEVLARWMHPEFGIVSPAYFEMMFETPHLCNELSAKIMLAALQDFKHWRMNGIDVSLSINFTWTQLENVGLTDYISSLIEIFSIPAHQIIIEVVESFALEQSDAAMDNLLRLHLKGFRIALDDFGTGYANYQKLISTPLSQVKIDRSFVHMAAGNELATDVLRSIVKLANAFSLEVVAEGVERKEDFDLVVALGCKEVQGYFISKPVGCFDLLKLMKKGWNA